MNEFLRRVFSPSELNKDVRIHLEAGFGLVDVEGEISNLSRPTSGHLYFSIKDQKAQIRCAMFRNRASMMRFPLENGMQVRLTAKVSLYEPRGDFQLIAERMTPAGEGQLRQLYEELKRRLTAEGLFDPRRKQSLPTFPKIIGLITSPSGAAVRDLIHVLERRYPMAEVRIYPSAVQGSEAPGELRRALFHAIQEATADVLIIGRGGGSLEDLWAFNDEGLVRDVAACPIPIISAVGHEVDFSLCDEAADIRAPTPSAAAEIATPDREALLHHLGQLQQRLGRDHQRRLQVVAQRLDYTLKRLQLAHPARQLVLLEQRLQRGQKQLLRFLQARVQHSRLRVRGLNTRLQALNPQRQINQSQQRLQGLQKRLSPAIQRQLLSKQQSFAGAIRTLHLASPLATLARGYTIALDEVNHQAISNYQSAQKTECIRLIGQDYELVAEVKSVEQIHRSQLNTLSSESE